MEKVKNTKEQVNDINSCDHKNQADAENKCNCSDNDCENGTNENNAGIIQADDMEIQMEKKTKQCEEYLNMLQRTAAEFDNYKKRTLKEKEALYNEAVSDVIQAFLPVIDNLERAVKAANSDDEGQSIKEGIELVSRQIKDVVKSLGIEEIKCIGEKFSPELHNAVMHIDDDSLGENIIADEFQKGYIYKDRVIRHSVVKVAN